MSTPPLLSDFSPRIRSRQNQPSMLALSQQSRNALSRMLKRRTLKEEVLAFYARQSDGLPFIPSYLTHSLYAHLVKQQYILFNKRIVRKEPVSTTTTTTTAHPNWQVFAAAEEDQLDFSLHDYATTNANSEKRLSVQEAKALEAVISQDHFNLTLAVQDLRLPSAWDMRAKGDNVELSPDRMQLTYRGSIKDDVEVASVRANHAMRRQCGIYYFELQVISKGVDGHIGIGFCRRINSLDRFPGWEEHSWGYHGENGNVYFGPGTERSYGPKFGTGDVIGCGVDFRDMSAFYTKNGIYLGKAFKKIKETDLYPFVGFKTPGESVEANFGSKPFKFDIQQYMSNEKRDLVNKISMKPIETKKSRSQIINNFTANTFADKVVVEFLRHNGYNKTADSLEAAIKLKFNNGGSSCSDLPPEEEAVKDADAIRRQDIRAYILEGDIDKAIDLCNTHYPSVLKVNPWVEFRLQCRKFMEMVKRAQRGINNVVSSVEDYETQSLEVSKSSPRKRTPSKAVLVESGGNKKKKKQKLNHSEQSLESFQDVMEFGSLLKSRYKLDSEQNERMKNELTVTFSTLAYSDLSHKAVSYLYEIPYIEVVASELNSAILVSLNKYPNSALERIYRQTTTTIEELVLGGNARAALLEPERDCFNF